MSEPDDATRGPGMPSNMPDQEELRVTREWTKYWSLAKSRITLQQKCELLQDVYCHGIDVGMLMHNLFLKHNLLWPPNKTQFAACVEDLKSDLDDQLNIDPHFANGTLKLLTPDLARLVTEMPAHKKKVVKKAKKYFEAEEWA